MAELKTKTIGIVQVKGGAGRSTLATTIAGELAKVGKTALIDCDMPQGTSSSWASLRQATLGRSVIGAHTATNHRELITLASQLAGSVDWVVLDGGPRIAETTRAILALSDLVLVPVGASPAELWATTDVIPLIDEAKKVRAVDARLVWTRFRAHTRLAMDLEAQAGKELGLKPLKSKLGFRVAYAEALGDGSTAAEVGDTLAREEVEAMVSEIRRILK